MSWPPVHSTVGDLAATSPSTGGEITDPLLLNDCHPLAAVAAHEHRHLMDGYTFFGSVVVENVSLRVEFDSSRPSHLE